MIDESRRAVTAHIECDVETPVDLVLAVAVADGPKVAMEQLSVEVAGVRIEMVELRDDHGTRLHRRQDLPAGSLVIDYSATTTSFASPVETVATDLIRYLRPSRYCESDRLAPVARSEFRGLTGVELLTSVSSWVGTRIGYVPGYSRPIDGAVATMLARQGVCRDFAHLVIALLRGCGVPARLVSVYAPGLSPMDFHAVAEAHDGERWSVVDPTCLAPRSTMIRIATGRDAADTAFMTTTGGLVTLRAIEVTATTDTDLPADDIDVMVELR